MKIESDGLKRPNKPEADDGPFEAIEVVPVTSLGRAPVVPQWRRSGLSVAHIAAACTLFSQYL